jgi:hypothetical protein
VLPKRRSNAWQAAKIIWSVLDELTRLPAEMKPEVARRFNWDAQMLRRVFRLKTAIPLPANLCLAACAHRCHSFDRCHSLRTDLRSESV